MIGEYDEIEIPPVKPYVIRHHRFTCRCAYCGIETKAPAVATTTPFGPRIHALAIYLKGFQALSYERLSSLFRDAFGLSVSEGALMNMFIRSHPRFEIEAEKAKAIVRAAQVVASDETGVRIEGTNSYHWVFHCKNAVVHQPDYSRAARVVDETMGGHRPKVWISDRYSAPRPRPAPDPLLRGPGQGAGAYGRGRSQGVRRAGPGGARQGHQTLSAALLGACFRYPVWAQPTERL